MNKSVNTSLRPNLGVSIAAGGSRLPACHKTVDENQYGIRLKSPSAIIFSATRIMVGVIKNALKKNNLTIHEIDLIITHQVNLQIIKSGAKRAKILLEKIFINIENIGSTSAASILITIYESLKQKILTLQFNFAPCFRGRIYLGFSVDKMGIYMMVR